MTTVEEVLRKKLDAMLDEAPGLKETYIDPFEHVRALGEDLRKTRALLLEVMGSKVCWFVSSVHANPTRGDRRTRTWVYFLTKEAAIANVKNSVRSMSENRYYTHAVIECVRPGRDLIEEEIWFYFDGDTATECEKPEPLKRTINFCLG